MTRKIFLNQKIMDKPKPKNFGYDYKYKCWPDKQSLQKYREAHHAWYMFNLEQKKKVTN